MNRFTDFTALREWWHGKGDDQPEPKGEPIVPSGDDDVASGDACPMGGEHEPQEIRAATQRAPLSVFCVKCRLEFPVDE